MVSEAGTVGSSENMRGPKAGIGTVSFLRDAGIASRLGVLIGLFAVLLIGIGAIALYALAMGKSQLQSIYSDRVIPMERAAQIQRLTLENRLLVLEAVVRLGEGEDIRQNLSNIQKSIDDITVIMKTAMADARNERVKELVEEYRSARINYGQNSMLPMVAALRAGDRDEAAMLEELAGEMYAPVKEAISNLVAHEMQSAKDDVDSVIASQKKFELVMVGSVSGGLLLAAVIAWIIVRSITRPLARAVALADGVAQGDLARDIDIQAAGETGVLLRALASMNIKLREIVADVRRSAANITRAAEEIASGNSSLSERTEEQASSLQQAASSMEEMMSTVRQNAENAQRANQAASSARDLATQGALSITNTIGAISEIEQSSGKIANIIGVIDEIAFQTNLLALNAAVEAARAGEQGRGFAVVAAEVRNLAQRSAAAANEIKDLIEESTEKVKMGSEMVENSGEVLAEIAGGVTKVSELVAEIAAASQEQTTGIDQVGKAVTSIDEMTQKNAALVEQVASASKAMEEQAQALTGLIAFFKIGAGREMAVMPAAGKGAENVLPHDSARSRGAADGARNDGVRPVRRKTGTDDREWEEF